MRTPSKSGGRLRRMASKISGKNCSMCSFEAPTIRLVLSHLRSVHSSDPRFNVMCGIDGCARTYRTFSGLHSHIYRCHWTSTRGITNSIDTPSSAEDQTECMEVPSDSMGSITSDVQADIDYLLGDRTQQQRSSALFLLKLKEERRLTQVAIDDVVAGIGHVLEQCVVRAKAGVRAKLASGGVDPDNIVGLDDVFSEMVQPFAGLETGFKQESYFKDVLGLLEPEAKKLGDPEYIPRFSGDKRELVPVWDTFQYVPLLKTLEKLIQDPDIREEIEGFPRRMNGTSLQEDFCDGKMFREHPLFSSDPLALQIIAYFDELEVCNPLGSHVKRHKLGIVFFTLGNIRPKLRSSLKAIHLVAVATSPVIDKYGLNRILEPFITDLNLLSTRGISVKARNCEQVFRGALLAFLADNLGSNALGGFKMSFSFAYRYCRTCLLPNKDAPSTFDSKNFVMRSTASHRKHCEDICGVNGSHYSKTYGINTYSSLLDVKYFSLFNGGLPHDSMHDILEGIGPKEVKLLLAHCISEKYFTLNEYNEVLNNFNYGYSDNDKPVPVLASSFAKDGPLRSSAAQMLTLFRNLPLMIGKKVPENDEHWLCFLLLRRIFDIVMCPALPHGTGAILKMLIIEHHTLYISLYGQGEFIPKMHFLTHYPEQMENIGPIIRAWTMRHEAKLNFFKQASRVSNFKNIAQSVAKRHQRWLCYQLAKCDLLRFPLECGPGDNSASLGSEPNSLRECILQFNPAVDASSSLFRPTWVRYEGVLYKANNCYLIKESDGLDPKFVKLIEILVIGNSLVIFVVNDCRVLYFDNHYHAYALECTPTKSVVNADNLYDHNVYHGHIIDTVIHISLKHYFVS